MGIFPAFEMDIVILKYFKSIPVFLYKYKENFNIHINFQIQLIVCIFINYPNLISV